VSEEQCSVAVLRRYSLGWGHKHLAGMLLTIPYFIGMRDIRKVYYFIDSVGA
jgi:hypothetical protein